MYSFLTKFCAVTTSGSLYVVELGKKNGSRKVIVRKIAEGGRIKNPPEEFQDDMLVVAKCLMLFPEQKKRWIIPTADCRTLTSSPIAGLFLSEDKAIECVGSEKLEKCDPRWDEHTAKVLAEIGHDHPYCAVPTDESFC